MVFGTPKMHGIFDGLGKKDFFMREKIGFLGLLQGILLAKNTASKIRRRCWILFGLKKKPRKIR